jgi:hypothetical protein
MAIVAGEDEFFGSLAIISQVKLPLVACDPAGDVRNGDTNCGKREKQRKRCSAVNWIKRRLERLFKSFPMPIIGFHRWQLSQYEANDRNKSSGGG